jgi:hypothetical protein
MSNRKNNSSNWGPENPHPLSRLKTELVWEGKYPPIWPTQSRCLTRFRSIGEHV